MRSCGSEMATVIVMSDLLGQFHDEGLDRALRKLEVERREEANEYRSRPAGRTTDPAVERSGKEVKSSGAQGNPRRGADLAVPHGGVYGGECDGASIASVTPPYGPPS